MDRKWMALALGCAILGPWSAGELAAEDTPTTASSPAKSRAAFESLRAKIPAAQAKTSVSLRETGYVVLGGQDAGTYRVEVGATKEDKSWSWSAREIIDPDVAAVTTEAVFFGPGLAHLHGIYSDGNTSTQWHFEGKGVELKTRRLAPGEKSKQTTQTLPREGVFLTTVPSIFLFASITAFKPGSYACDVLVLKKTTFARAAWTVKPTMWKGELATLIQGTHNSVTFRAILRHSDPRLPEYSKQAGPTSLVFHPGASATDRYFSEDPKSAEQAACQAALSIWSSRKNELGRVIHWPTLFAAAKQDDPDLDETREAFRNRTLKEIAERFPEPIRIPRAVAKMLFQRAASFRTTRDGDATIVQVSMQQDHLVPIKVQAFRKRWYLIEIPEGLK